MDIEFLRDLSAQELIEWAEAHLNLFLDVNADEASLLGQLVRFGVPIDIGL